MADYFTPCGVVLVLDDALEVYAKVSSISPHQLVPLLLNVLFLLLNQFLLSILSLLFILESAGFLELLAETCPTSKG